MSSNLTVGPSGGSYTLPRFQPLTWSPQYAAAAFTLVVSLVWFSWKKWTGSRPGLLPGIHVVGGSSRHEMVKNRGRFMHHSKDMLLEGYRHSSGQDFYYVPSLEGERLVIPTRFMEELKSAPMHKVDFVGVVRELMEGRYTLVGDRSRLHPDTLKSHLTPRLALVVPAVQDEIRQAVSDVFPPCDDWTEVAIVPAMTELVTRATSRMLGGLSLSRNKEWIDAAVEFAHHAFYGAQKIKAIPWPVRPLLAPLIPEIRTHIPNCVRATRRAAIPILEQRERDGEKTNDFLSFLKEAAKGKQRDNKYIAKSMLLTAFASVHTSSAAPCQLIYDLCNNPQYFDLLRAEYAGLIDHDGQIPKGAFGRMTKMDSCMKESQRLWPATLLTFERIIHEDRTLSNGLTVPAGTHIGVSNYAVGRDPNIFPKPDEFDGLRFEKMRNADPSMEGKAQFVSCNQTSLTFGYGRHACPGRFFLADEFKAIMVRLLETFDMKFAEGQTRPEPAQFESQWIIDPSTKILFKRRKPVIAQ